MTSARTRGYPVLRWIGLAILAILVLVVGRRVPGDVDLRLGAVRQLAKAGSKIGVGMAVEDRDDLQALAFRLLEVIVDVAFRIDHRSLALRAKEIGSMRQSFDKESFQIHDVIGS